MRNQKPLSSISMQRISGMKPVSMAVLCAELLDIVTTFFGLSLFPQMSEANPMASFLGGMPATILVKILVIALVILVLEKVEKWPRIVWIIPITASVAVVWNLVIILAELILPRLTL